jgi:DNA-binding NarL/FixJ family response regulator
LRRTWAEREVGAIADHGPVTLLIADHDPLARQAVREAMSSREDVVVVAEASSSAEAVAAVMHEAPDIVLLDTELPPAGGISATAQLLAIEPRLPVVLFSVQDDEDVGLYGLEAGATGFLSKDIDMSALARALRSVVRGEAAVSRRLALHAIERLRTVTAQVRSMRPVRSPLTNRQWEILDLLGEGRTTSEIAQQLGLSSATVRGHLRMLLRALEAHTPAEAIQAAQRLRGG